MDGLTEGRIVHYVMPNGEHRPAIVVKVWDHEEPSGTSNLQVFTDGVNDKPWNKAEKELLANSGLSEAEVAHGHFWKTSIMHSDEYKVNTWHWIEGA